MSAATDNATAEAQVAGGRLIHLVTGTAAPAGALLRFADPVASHAVVVPAGTPASKDGDVEPLTVAVYPFGEARETFAEWTSRVAETGRAAPIYLKARGVELWWCPGQAVLQCDRNEADALVGAVAEFQWYEGVLRGLEAGVVAGWSHLEQDRPLAFDVTAADLRGSDAVGARMGEAFQRRIHFSRLEPHLFAADATMTAAAQKLGNDLREKARFEDRAEALDAHLETFEHIYEMASQRMGEFRASQQGHRVEWIIIWLLVAEVTLSLLQTVLKR
ncbi:MAG: hypothetical protein ACRYF4_08450 [Janthinobacterium lividum]